MSISGCKQLSRASFRILILSFLELDFEGHGNYRLSRRPSGRHFSGRSVLARKPRWHALRLVREGKLLVVFTGPPPKEEFVKPFDVETQGREYIGHWVPLSSSQPSNKPGRHDKNIWQYLCQVSSRDSKLNSVLSSHWPASLVACRIPALWRHWYCLLGGWSVLLDKGQPYSRTEFVSLFPFTAGCWQN